jgi:hypothetical protein
MIYVHDDMRYIVHAFPKLYVEYWRRKEKIYDKWDTGQGWSFSGGLGGMAKDLKLLRRWLHSQLDCNI